MNIHEHHELEAGNKSKRRQPKQRDDVFARNVKTLIGGLIGTVLIGLFGVVIFAFVIKAFVTSEEMSFQLLNSAITLVSTTLGAALGYFLGRSSNDKGEGTS